MATHHDVARALADLSHGIARQVNDEPTGVEPGFHEALGAAVLPNGRLRAVRQANADYTRITLAANQTYATSGLSQEISWDTAILNPAGWFDAGTPGRITVDRAGLFLAVANATWDANSTGSRKIDIEVNSGSGNTYARSRTAAIATSLPMSLSVPLVLAAGDYVRVFALQSSGGSLDLLGSTDGGGSYHSTFILVQIG